MIYEKTAFVKKKSGVHQNSQIIFIEDNTK